MGAPDRWASRSAAGVVLVGMTVGVAIPAGDASLPPGAGQPEAAVDTADTPLARIGVPQARSTSESAAVTRSTGGPPAAPPPEPAGPEAAPSPVSAPAALTVSAIGVRSRLVALGLEPDGSLEVPSDFSLAGWYTEGARPGQPGPLVIAGHVDSRDGAAVFFRLGELAPGDLIEVIAVDGTTTAYTVERLERHPKDAFPTFAVYGATDQPSLRLITCGGRFDRSARSYTDNVIVYAS